MRGGGSGRQIQFGAPLFKLWATWFFFLCIHLLVLRYLSLGTFIFLLGTSVLRYSNLLAFYFLSFVLVSSRFGPSALWYFDWLALYHQKFGNTSYNHILYVLEFIHLLSHVLSALWFCYPYFGTSIFLPLPKYFGYNYLLALCCWYFSTSIFCFTSLSCSYLMFQPESVRLWPSQGSDPPTHGPQIRHPRPGHFCWDRYKIQLHHSHVINHPNSVCLILLYWAWLWPLPYLALSCCLVLSALTLFPYFWTCQLWLDPLISCLVSPDLTLIFLVLSAMTWLSYFWWLKTVLEQRLCQHYLAAAFLWHRPIYGFCLSMA